MGYLIEKYKRLIRSSKWLMIKERWTTTRIIRTMDSLYQDIYQKLPTLVREQHRIKEAIKLQEKIISEFEKISERIKNVTINVCIQGEKEFEIIEKIEKEFEEIEKAEKKAESKFPELKKKFYELDKIFVFSVVSELEKEEVGLRKLYGTDATVIRASNDPDTFIQKVRLYLKSKKPSNIQALRMRLEEKGIVQAQEGLKYDKKRFRDLYVRFEKVLKSKKNDKREEILKIINDVLKEEELLKKHIKWESLETCRVLSQNFTLALLLLTYMYDLIDKKNKFIKDKVMPAEPETKFIKKIEGDAKEVGFDFQIIAQAMRILVKELNNDKKKAKRLEKR